MKTYELTQEQINQLAEVPNTQYLLQEFIPEAFETKLEVGKWYISEHYLAYYLGDYKCNCIKLSDGAWFENIYHSLSGHLKSYKLATKEEVREALINEFKKRLGKNKKVKTLKDTWEEPIIIEVNFEEFRYHSKENELWTSCKKTGIGYKVFDNGVWAEIIEEKNTFYKDYLDNKITEIHSLLGDIKQYVNQLENEN